MTNRRTPHLTRNRHGVYHYQRWLPSDLLKRFPTLKRVFRVSLGTSNPKQAARLARKLTVYLDDLALRHFDSAEDFGKAMELLYESAKAARECGGDFHCYEEKFLMDLEQDSWELHLHKKGERFRDDIQERFSQLESEQKHLKQVLSKLAGQSGSIDKETLERVLAEITNPPIPEDQNPTLSQVFEEWKEKYQGEMVKSSFDEYSRMITLFIRIIEDYAGSDEVRISDITKKHIQHYQKTLKAIPSRVNASKYSISELVKLKGKPKSPTTIKNTYGNISHFLGFIRLHYDSFNGDLVHYVVKGDKIKSTLKDKIKRPPFTDDELKLLFNSDRYLTGNIKYPSMYWAPLIALFTGARMSEILQLEVSDITTSYNVPVISFSDIEPSKDKNKRLKAKGSHRKVPIHKQLIKLGFLDFVDSIGRDSLFNEPRNKTGKFDSFQKRFANYIKSCKVLPEHEREQKGFHNFRHTVRTRLSELGKSGKASERFDEGIIDSIVGHVSKDRSIGQSNYSHSDFIHIKQRAVNRLQYDSIDFDKIRPWRECKFWRIR